MPRLFGYFQGSRSAIVVNAELRSPTRRADIMAMPLPLPHYTLADLDSFPDDGQRYELLAGFLIVTPQAAAPHQLIAARLIHRLTNYLGDRAYALGPGVVEQAPDTHLEPDVLVFPPPFPKTEKWTDLAGHWLAIEVYSRSSRRYDHDYKRDAYLALGVAEVWLVDRWARSVLVSTAEGERDRRVNNLLTWHPPGVSEALGLDVAALFADL